MNVLNWTDYIEPSALSDFTSHTGIAVRYETFDSDEALEERLFKRESGLDVVVPSASFLERQIQAGLFQKLDKSKLPNLSNMDAEMVMPLVGLHDPGNQYAIPYLWGTTGIGYNEAAVRKVLGDQPLDSWKFVYDPQWAARFKDCGISFLDAPDEILKTMLIWMGRDPNSESPDDLAHLQDALAKLKPYLRKVDSSEYIDALASGELCIAVGWSGDVLQARERALSAGDGVSIQYVIPKEGATVWFDMLAIPVNAAHPEQAHTFINYLMEPRVAARNTNFVQYANGNRASLAYVDEAIRSDPSIYPSDEMKKSLHPTLAYEPQVKASIDQVWKQFAQDVNGRR